MNGPDGDTPIPFIYHTAGRTTDGVFEDELGELVAGEFLSGKYTMRFDNAHYYQNENAPQTPDGLHEEILVTGVVSIMGEFFSPDFSDISTVVPLSDTLTYKWRYTVTDIDGVFVTATGGTLVFDLSTGDVSYVRAYGPCEQP